MNVNTVNQLSTYSKQAKGRPFYFIKADRDYCGSNGIRDDGMLDSALANPFQSFGDEDNITEYRALSFAKDTYNKDITITLDHIPEIMYIKLMI